MKLVALLLAAVACSGSSSGQDCDAVADAIRKAAISRGISPSGICNSTDPTIQKDFGPACASLRSCQDE